MKTFHLFTLGCPKNEVDSEYVLRDLLDAGMKHVIDPLQADVVLVNTCGFLQDALAEARQALQMFTQQKQDGQEVIVFGCAVGRLGDELWADISGVSAGFEMWGQVVRYLKQQLDNSAGVYTDSVVQNRLRSRRLDIGRVFAYVKIADGCDQNCSFCTIPSIKGPYVSRQPDQVISEIGSLLDLGIKEIILIAQNTTAYGSDWRRIKGVSSKKAGRQQQVSNLAQLIEAICDEYPQLPWLRIMYAYPSFVTDELIDVMASYEQVLPYLDLPLQHASPAILKAMKRPADISAVELLLSKVRLAMPDISLRSVFITGFPGETDDDQLSLLKFIQKMRFDHVGIFKYSPEPGTPSATMQQQVPDRIKQQRYDEIMGEQQTIAFECNQALIGKRLEVLIESEVESDQVKYLGRSYRNAPEIDGFVLVNGDAQIGELVQVEITQASEYEITGRLA